jgi:hypothetical protein
MAAVVF